MFSFCFFGIYLHVWWRSEFCKIATKWKKDTGEGKGGGEGDKPSRQERQGREHLLRALKGPAYVCVCTCANMCQCCSELKPRCFCWFVHRSKMLIALFSAEVRPTGGNNPWTFVASTNHYVPFPISWIETFVFLLILTYRTCRETARKTCQTHTLTRTRANTHTQKYVQHEGKRTAHDKHTAHAYTRANIHTCKCAYAHMRMHTHTHMHIYTHTHNTHTHTHTDAQKHTNAHRRTQTHTRTHTITYTHTCTHTHTRISTCT